MIKTIAAALVLLILAGCATHIIPEGRISEGAKHVQDKNYALGQKKKATVGEPIIKVRDFYVEKFHIPAMKPTESVIFKGGIVTLVYTADKNYPIKGRMTVDSVPYLIVASSENPVQFMGVLVNENGNLSPYVANSLNGNKVIKMVYDFEASSPTVKFERVTEEKVSVEKGYQNYEVLYNGMDKNSMHFTYREFTPEGMARTAFYQNLTYDAKASSIRFKKFKVNIASVNSEEIEYSVIEDE